MKQSGWWQHNEKYVKAWFAFGVLLWALQLLMYLLGLTQAPLISLGLNESTAHYTVWVISVIVWLPLSYCAFRGVVRKFIGQNPE